ncbi:MULTISPECIES: DNA repair exonuclease [Lactobacillus]|uniref:DNA repair exonuclease n=1 Tax=Lactobacillus xujianguonis TaxID=2495899 RepID=A0A437SUI6_9LACO|nr:MULTISPECIES: DNA repair exonuclease [Lactobacillus]RVU70585.1 DNA repair exonuclease [Lactobacillus xujianguonis]RVU73790.1 DNA repair exonuclease [Lactobacillus xujianguonis]
MKFIHFADAHLDSPFRGLSFLPSKAFNQIYNAANQSLKRIVDLALSEQVDLVLIAGDTFDSNHPSPHSQLLFAQEIKRLTDAQIQVVMIFGNHDHMKRSELLVTPSPYFKLLGPDEKVEQVTFTTKTGFTYDVVGFSYLNNHITSDKLPEFPEKGANYTFGMMHAQEKTSTNSQNVYAPFTVQEMQELNYDYFALGHIHARRTLSTEPLIVYPGNIQGRHINELGPKGCYLGEVNEASRETKIDFYATSPIIWQSVQLELTAGLSKADLQAKILASLTAEQTTYFSLQLLGARFLTEEETDLITDSDFWQNLSLQLAADSQLVDVRFKEQEQLQLNDHDQAAFNQAADEIFAPEEFKQIIKDWAKKDELTAQAADQPEFLQAVKELAQVKLAAKLKGIDDETQEN